MTITKTMATVGIGAAIVTGSMLAVSAAGAHGSTSSSTGRATEFAERFDLSEDEVKQYFEERRGEYQAEREEKHAERLEALVEDGTLTQEQADALSAKKDEIHEAKEALQDGDLTRSEMREQMEAAREEFKTWADEQGIDLDSIRQDSEGEKGDHRMGPRGFGGPHSES